MGSQLGFVLGSSNAVLDTYDESLAIVIDGVARTSAIHLESFVLSGSLEDGWTCECTVWPSPATWGILPGHRVRILRDGPSGSVVLFAGTVLQTVQRLDGTPNGFARRTVRARDERWLLDRTGTVTGVWEGLSVNTLVHRVLAVATTDGWRVGDIGSHLGSIARFDATKESVISVLDRIAALAGAWWEADADRRVSMYAWTEGRRGYPTMAMAPTDGLVVETALRDYSDMGNTVEVLGRGTVTRATVTTGSSTVPVREVTWAEQDTGTALLGTDVITYAGTTTVPGHEALQMVSGVTRDWPEGTEVRPIVTAADASAVAAWATRLGGGLSGVVRRVIRDDALPRPQLSAFASRVLTQWADGIRSAELRGLVSRVPAWRRIDLGRWITLTLSDIEAFAVSGIVSRIRRRPRYVGATLTWEIECTVRSVPRNDAVLQALRRG